MKIGPRLIPAGIDADVVALNHVVIARTQYYSRRLETTNREATHSSVTGSDNQATLKTYIRAIEFDEGRAGVSWLRGGVDYHWISNLRQRCQQGDLLHSRSGNVENNRVGTRQGVRSCERLAQRSRSMIVHIRHDKTVAIRGEVSDSRCGQVVDGEERWIK